MPDILWRETSALEDPHAAATAIKITSVPKIVGEFCDPAHECCGVPFVTRGQLGHQEFDVYVMPPDWMSALNATVAVFHDPRLAKNGCIIRRSTSDPTEH